MRYNIQIVFIHFYGEKDSMKRFSRYSKKIKLRSSEVNFSLQKRTDFLESLKHFSLLNWYSVKIINQIELQRKILPFLSKTRILFEFCCIVKEKATKKALSTHSKKAKLTFQHCPYFLKIISFINI